MNTLLLLIMLLMDPGYPDSGVAPKQGTQNPVVTLMVQTAVNVI